MKAGRAKVSLSCYFNLTSEDGVFFTLISDGGLSTLFLFVKTIEKVLKYPFLSSSFEDMGILS